MRNVRHVCDLCGREDTEDVFFSTWFGFLVIHNLSYDPDEKVEICPGCAPPDGSDPVAWRVEAMRARVPATGPLPYLVARDAPQGPRRCPSCGEARELNPNFSWVRSDIRRTNGLRSDSLGEGYHLLFPVLSLPRTMIEIELVVVRNVVPWNKDEWEWALNLFQNGSLERFVAEGRASTCAYAASMCRSAAKRFIRPSRRWSLETLPLPGEEHPVKGPA